jgi:5-carboxymethyl-2-hydroxymuconic-semialdehyde dehydrogenase
VHFELGGKNPVVVFEDADLDRAIEAALFMIYSLNGERCTSSSRALVQRSVAERVSEALALRAAQIRVGHPLDPDTEIGPLSHPRHTEKVLAYNAVARADGAHIRCGGGHPDGFAGNYVAPTLYTDAASPMRIAQEEIFGPVLSVIPWRDEAEMLDQVNDVSYGLTANIWTNDLRAAHRLAEEVEAGFVWVNGDGRHFAGAPFGGYKSSGVGVEESLDELLSYTQSKNVSVFL